MKNYSETDLEGFRTSQKLAYECALAIKNEIKPGWTEKQTAQLMDTYLRDCGVKAFFHKSFAWFGDRTRFQNFTNQFHFLPKNRELCNDDVVILDTAPIVNGYTSDIGYTFSLTANRELDQAMKLLSDFRDEIPKLFMSDLKTTEIWQKVDQELKAKGYDNCHEQYPFSVLGHRIRKISASHLPSVTIPFGLHAIASLASHGILPELLGPKKNLDKSGLWAIEPHLGAKGFGAKFEEILVVEESGKAYWLDDEVPHARRPVLNLRSV